MDNKKQWPECTKMLAEQAKQLINNEDPEIQVQLLKEGSMATKDYRLNRVRIYFDGDNKVVGIPHRG